MIEANDKQTIPLAMDEQPTKRKRGRPATGQAMSNAERQKAYRERRKAQAEHKLDLSNDDITDLRVWLEMLADQLEGSVGATRARKMLKRVEALQIKNRPTRVL